MDGWKEVWVERWGWLTDEAVRNERLDTQTEAGCLDVLVGRHPRAPAFPAALWWVRGPFQVAEEGAEGQRVLALVRGTPGACGRHAKTPETEGHTGPGRHDIAKLARSRHGCDQGAPQHEEVSPLLPPGPQT